MKTPVDCLLGDGQLCYIQNYVDHDPGPEHRDFACNELSYDTHKGTDFALPTYADMDRNIDVLAAADGIVKGTRDGMADRVFTIADTARLSGRECGNGVVLDHGNGWETQYCHLKRGSLAVKSGDKVRTGEVLGHIGMSGKAAFPHLHLSVRHNGMVVDPFAPDMDASECTPNPTETLWSDPVAYHPGGLLDAGFSGGVPDYADIKAGTAGTTHLTKDAAALVLWGFAFGSRAEDVLRLTIFDNAGHAVFTTDQTLDRPQAQLFRAAGRRTRSADWFRPGTYRGEVELRRDGYAISTMTTTVTITD